MIPLKLSEEAIQFILQALLELPGKICNPISADIINQYNEFKAPTTVVAKGSVE